MKKTKEEQDREKAYRKSIEDFKKDFQENPPTEEEINATFARDKERERVEYNNFIASGYLENAIIERKVLRQKKEKKIYQKCPGRVFKGKKGREIFDLWIKGFHSVREVSQKIYPKAKNRSHPLTIVSQIFQVLQERDYLDFDMETREFNKRVRGNKNKKKLTVVPVPVYKINWNFIVDFARSKICEELHKPNKSFLAANPPMDAEEKEFIWMKQNYRSILNEVKKIDKKTKDTADISFLGCLFEGLVNKRSFKGKKVTIEELCQEGFLLLKHFRIPKADFVKETPKALSKLEKLMNTYAAFETNVYTRQSDNFATYFLGNIDRRS
jgi:hypothetical protein